MSSLSSVVYNQGQCNSYMPLKTYMLLSAPSPRFSFCVELSQVFLETLNKFSWGKIGSISAFPIPSSTNWLLLCSTSNCVNNMNYIWWYCKTLYSMYLRKMKRFWRKNAMPCHQWGKPGSHAPPECCDWPGDVEVIVIVLLLFVAVQSSVTAKKSKKYSSSKIFVVLQNILTPVLVLKTHCVLYKQ